MSLAGLPAGFLAAPGMGIGIGALRGSPFAKPRMGSAPAGDEEGKRAT